MIPLELVDSTVLPDGGDLRLMRRGDDFMILFGRNELMSSRLRGSEESLATLTCEPLAKAANPRILIGGLGMGFTLRAALRTLPRTAAIDVAELVPAIADWARGPLAHLFGDCLDDPRVALHIEDVRAAISRAQDHWDAILLDVDNGPDGLIHAANDHLYSDRGLRDSRDALRPGGVLAIWSAYADAAFTARLKRVGFRVEECRVRAREGKKGAHHMIWLCTRR